MGFGGFGSLFGGDASPVVNVPTDLWMCTEDVPLQSSYSLSSRQRTNSTM